MKAILFSKQFLFFSFFLAANLPVYAQKLPAHALQVAGGYSSHGSGDMKGIFTGVDYVSYHSPRFSLNYNMRFGINSRREAIYITNGSSGIARDASIRFTTAGVQLGVNAQLSLFRTIHHELLAGLGGFGRYQSASNGSDGYSVYYPTATGVPTVLIGYDNTTPQHTVAAGALALVQYNIRVCKEMYLGLLASFQTDTNGDAIPSAGLVVGRRF